MGRRLGSRSGCPRAPDVWGRTGRGETKTPPLRELDRRLATLRSEIRTRWGAFNGCDGTGVDICDIDPVGPAIARLQRHRRSSLATLPHAAVSPEAAPGEGANASGLGRSCRARGRCHRHRGNAWTLERPVSLLMPPKDRHCRRLAKPREMYRFVRSGDVWCNSSRDHAAILAKPSSAMGGFGLEIAGANWGPSCLPR